MAAPILLSSTYNAIDYAGATSEAKITAAIADAVTNGVKYVFLAQSLLPYDPASVTFNSAVKLIREGGRDDVWDIEAYGATPGLGSFSTKSIQAAIDAADANGGGIVYFPSTAYAIGDHELKFHGNIVLQGRAGGGVGSASATQLHQGSGSFKLLAPSNPATPTENFEIRDLTLSAFGNSNNTGGVDLTNCCGFQLDRVTITGTKSYGVRVVGGPNPGDSGFGNITRCAVVNLDGSAACFLFSGTANDQPDGIALTDCYVASQSIWIKTNASGGGHGPQTLCFSGCRFEANSANRIEAILSDSAGFGACFVGCRFENTGNGGLAVTLYAVGTQQSSQFFGNAWAAGPGQLQWTDWGFVPSNRFADQDHGLGGGSAPIALSHVSTIALSIFTLTDASTVSVPASRGAVMKLPVTAAVGGTRTIGMPSGLYLGQRLTFLIKQDGTGGRNVSWNSAFKHAWTNTGNTANKQSTISFIYDGTNLVQEGAQSPWV